MTTCTCKGTGRALGISDYLDCRLCDVAETRLDLGLCCDENWRIHQRGYEMGRVYAEARTAPLNDKQRHALRSAMQSSYANGHDEVADMLEAMIAASAAQQVSQ